MDLLELVAKISLDSSELESGLSGVQSKVGAGTVALGNLISTGIEKAAGAAVGFAKSSIETGSNFDSAMSQVAATLGNVADEEVNLNGSTQTTTEALRQLAEDMGANTAFSASQAADAINVLAMAGEDASTIYSTLPNVLSLASAGGLGIAEAADYATGIMAGFGLEAEDSAHIADLLAKTASSAKGDVASFGEGLSTVAGMASSTGQSLEDMSVELGILGNNNISASEAGNELSRMLKNLYQPTDAAKTALKDLGVSAYDAEGNARSLPDVLKDLNGALDGMSEEAKMDVLGNIFDSATLKNGGIQLINAANSFDELSATINDCEGAAQQMADVQLDNLNGDVTLFESALEGAQIKISNGLTPTLRDFVQLGTEGLTAFTEGMEEGGFEQAFENIGTWLGEALTQITEMLPEILSGAGTLITALGEALMENLPSLMDTAVQLILGLVSFLIEATPNIIDAATQIIITLVQGISTALPELIPAAVEAILTIVQGLVDNLPLLLDAGLQLIIGLGEGLIEALPTLIEMLPEIIDGIVNFFIEALPTIAEAGFELLVALVMNMPEILSALAEALPQIIDSLITFFTGKHSNIAQSGYELLIALIDKLADIISEVLEGIAEILDEIVKAIGDKYNDIVSAGYNLLLGLAEGIGNAVGEVVAKAVSIANSVVSAVKGALGIHSPSTVFAEIGENLDKGLAKGIGDNVGVVSKAIGELQDATEFDASANMALNTDVSGSISAQMVGTRSAMQEVVNAIQNLRIYLDGDVLVGGIRDRMDSAMGEQTAQSEAVFA